MNKRSTDQCLCGKITTSLAGRSNHQKNCNAAQAALNNNILVTWKPVTSVVVPCTQESYLEYERLSFEVMTDAYQAFTENNKSAARRARLNLVIIQKLCVKFREALLSVRNGGEQ